MRSRFLNRSERRDMFKNEVPRSGYAVRDTRNLTTAHSSRRGTFYFMVTGTAAIIAGSGHFCLPLLEDKIVFGLNWDSQSENLHPGPTNALSSG